MDEQLSRLERTLEKKSRLMSESEDDTDSDVFVVQRQRSVNSATKSSRGTKSNASTALKGILRKDSKKRGIPAEIEPPVDAVEDEKDTTPGINSWKKLYAEKEYLEKQLNKLIQHLESEYPGK